jgi:hypothetical protein
MSQRILEEGNRWFVSKTFRILDILEESAVEEERLKTVGLYIYYYRTAS